MSRRAWMIVGAAAVVLIGAWYMLLWKPAGQQLNAAQQALSQAQAAKDQAVLQHAAVLRQKAHLPAEEAKAAALGAAAPAQPHIDTLIDQISAAASASGVTWHSESQSEPAAGGAANSKTPSLPQLTLTLQVTGTYGQTLAFLNQLQAQPRLIKVTGVSVSGSGTAQGTGTAPAAASATLTTEVTAAAYDDPTALPATPVVKS